MQQSVELNEFSVELDDRGGLKSCTRVRRIIYRALDHSQRGYPDICLIHELRDADIVKSTPHGVTDNT